MTVARRGAGVSVVMAGIVFFSWSCKDNAVSGADGSPSDIVFPASNVSYQVHVQPLFNQTCALIGCHDAQASPQVGSLTSYSATVFDQPGNVIPGDPDNSILVIRIQGTSGTRMPVGKNPLNRNQIDGIRTWITEGAKNN
jgi:mono/diheme cytochrome c family protein